MIIDQVPDGPHDVRGASKAGEGGPWVMETFKKHPRDGAVVLGSWLAYCFHPLPKGSPFIHGVVPFISFSHFSPAIFLSTTVFARVRLLSQCFLCLLTWDFLLIFWSLFNFVHTHRPLLSRPRLLCNLLFFNWHFFFSDASLSSHSNPSPSSASLNSWRQKTQRRPSCLKAAIMICILQSCLKVYSPHF